MNWENDISYRNYRDLYCNWKLKRVLKSVNIWESTYSAGSSCDYSIHTVDHLPSLMTTDAFAITVKKKQTA